MNNFSSYDSNSQSVQSFYKSFKPNQQFVTNRNFNNKNDLLVNNVESCVLNQTIHNYIIDIDSTDRDYKIYPNPFDYKVTFNATSDTVMNGIRYKGTPGPSIVREFKNVKHIKLNNIILPICRGLSKIFNSETNTHDIIYANNLTPLNHERFIILNIDEIDNDTVYTTNLNARNTFGTIYNDVSFSPHFFYGVSFACYKIYRMSELGNIKSLHIQLLDSRGNQLTCDGLDSTVNTPKYCICADNNYTSADKLKCVCKYKPHPLNPAFQNFLSFTIGELDNSINMNSLMI